MKSKSDSGLSTPDGTDTNKQANMKHLQKHTYVPRVSILDDMDPNSELCKSQFLGFYNMLYVIVLYYFIVNPLMTYEHYGYFFETKLLNTIKRDFFLALLTWPLVIQYVIKFYLWSHMALLIQYLALKDIPKWMIFVLQHSSQSMMFFYCHYLVLTRNFCMSHGMFITFQSCVFFMKMHSYTMTNYKMRREWKQAGCPKHSVEYQYPNNISFKNFTTFFMIPVLVYEPIYPRTSKIRIGYALTKILNVIAIFLLIYMIACLHVVPIIENIKNISIVDSITYLTLPMVFLNLSMFILIFENYCNFWAEITYFADRLFYVDWWNSTNFEEFNRKWNRPVYEFLYRHVYLELIFEFQFSVKQAQFLTFVFSALLHEYSLCLSLQQMTPILIGFMMFQLLVVFCTRKIKGTKFGNIFFWWGIIQGVPLIMNMYIRFDEMAS